VVISVGRLSVGDWLVPTGTELLAAVADEVVFCCDVVVVDVEVVVVVAVPGKVVVVVVEVDVVGFVIAVVVVVDVTVETPDCVTDTQ
jgi:hypothetical protein